MNWTLAAAVGHGSTALWYMTRATGLVSLILLSATVVIGTVASVGWTTDRWPRFLSQSLHRNLSLLCLALIGIHIVTTVGDGYVPIGLADAVIPFRSPYRPIWVGLGALAFDLLLAVAITSALRRRIGAAAWRGVHWLAYASWPVAVFHGLGSGSDARLPGAIVVFVACTASVAVAVAWRLTAGRARSLGWRLGGALGGALVLLLMVVFANVGPLQPGWSRRAGTSSALLAQLSGAAATSYSRGTGTTPPPAASLPAGIPATPFDTSVSGTVVTTPIGSAGNSQVTLSMHLADTSVPLQVVITGRSDSGGVQMRQSAVTFGALSGQVSALDGSSLAAVVSGSSGPISLAIDLSLNPAAGTLTGEISGSAAQ